MARRKVLREIWPFTKDLGKAFWEDTSFSHAAALAYYTVFALAPVLVISTFVAGLFFRTEVFTGELYSQVARMVGPDAAKQIQGMVAHAASGRDTTVATIVAIITMIIGATGVVGELKTALNTIWGVKAVSTKGAWGLVKERLISFAIVVGLGFVLLVGLFVQTVAQAAGSYAGSALQLSEPMALTITHVVFDLGLSTALFAVVFKVLPDVKLHWRDVWIGSLFTAILFAIGKFLIGLYITRSDLGGTFGAASSIAVLLVWVYYSSIVLFIGAEFIQVWAGRYGTEVVPTRNAVRLLRAEVDAGGHVRPLGEPHPQP
jgi:membrane protein